MRILRPTPGQRADPDAGPPPPRSSRVAVIRGLLLRMVLWVLGIDAVAIATYYAAHLDRAAPRTRAVFTMVWMVATIVVVLTALRRIRLARRGR